MLPAILIMFFWLDGVGVFSPLSVCSLCYPLVLPLLFPLTLLPLMLPLLLSMLPLLLSFLWCVFAQFRFRIMTARIVGRQDSLRYQVEVKTFQDQAQKNQRDGSTFQAHPWLFAHLPDLRFPSPSRTMLEDNRSTLPRDLSDPVSLLPRSGSNGSRYASKASALT